VKISVKIDYKEPINANQNRILRWGTLYLIMRPSDCFYDLLQAVIRKMDIPLSATEVIYVMGDNEHKNTRWDIEHLDNPLHTLAQGYHDLTLFLSFGNNPDTKGLTIANIEKHRKLLLDKGRYGYPICPPVIRNSFFNVAYQTIATSIPSIPSHDAVGLIAQYAQLGEEGFDFAVKVDRYIVLPLTLVALTLKSIHAPGSSNIPYSEDKVFSVLYNAFVKGEMGQLEINRGGDGHITFTMKRPAHNHLCFEEFSLARDHCKAMLSQKNSMFTLPIVLYLDSDDTICGIYTPCYRTATIAPDCTEWSFSDCLSLYRSSDDDTDIALKEAMCDHIFARMARINNRPFITKRNNFYSIARDYIFSYYKLAHNEAGMALNPSLTLSDICYKVLMPKSKVDAALQHTVLDMMGKNISWLKSLQGSSEKKALKKAILDWVKFRHHADKDLSVLKAEDMALEAQKQKFFKPNYVAVLMPAATTAIADFDTTKSVLLRAIRKYQSKFSYPSYVRQCYSSIEVAKLYTAMEGTKDMTDLRKLVKSFLAKHAKFLSTLEIMETSEKDMALMTIKSDLCRAIQTMVIPDKELLDAADAFNSTDCDYRPKFLA
jgi:hypothetical protein